jgi:hypothetical protein
MMGAGSSSDELELESLSTLPDAAVVDVADDNVVVVVERRAGESAMDDARRLRTGLSDFSSVVVLFSSFLDFEVSFLLPFSSDCLSSFLLLLLDDDVVDDVVVEDAPLRRVLRLRLLGVPSGDGEMDVLLELPEVLDDDNADSEDNDDTADEVEEDDDGWTGLRRDVNGDDDNDDDTAKEVDDAAVEDRELRRTIATGATG